MATAREQFSIAFNILQAILMVPIFLFLLFFTFLWHMDPYVHEHFWMSLAILPLVATIAIFILAININNQISSGDSCGSVFVMEMVKGVLATTICLWFVAVVVGLDEWNFLQTIAVVVHASLFLPTIVNSYIVYHIETSPRGRAAAARIARRRSDSLDIEAENAETEADIHSEGMTTDEAASDLAGESESGPSESTANMSVENEEGTERSPLLVRSRS